MAETSGYGSSAPTLARIGDSCFETTGSRIVGSSEWIVLFWMRWTTLIGQVVDVRVLGEVHKWSGTEGGMAQLELDEQAAVGQREDQCGCGEQRAAWRCAVVLLDWTGIVSQMLHEVGVRGHGDFSCWRVPRRTMHWQC